MDASTDAVEKVIRAPEYQLVDEGTSPYPLRVHQFRGPVVEISKSQAKCLVNYVETLVKLD